MADGLTLTRTRLCPARVFALRSRLPVRFWPVRVPETFVAQSLILDSSYEDAISLCRGDRFYTADFTPWNLTAWGFQDCQRDVTNGGFGSMLGRRAYSFAFISRGRIPHRVNNAFV